MTTATPERPTTARNATLQDLGAMLADQHTRKVDVVANARDITAVNGMIVVTGTEPVLTADGVTQGDGLYRPTDVFDEGVAAKLGIPAGYLKRLRNERPDIYDINVNGWLKGIKDQPTYADAPADPRSFLLRTFKSDESGHGIARAFLSDRYGIIDNLDALHAALAGAMAVEGDLTVDSADLTERRMVVRVVAPEVQALAPTLLKGYRSPFNGASGDENPVLWAGFQIANSEVGSGAFTITPRLVVQICTNGMTVTKDALRSVHLGGKMGEGVIDWSRDTEQKALELITAKASDAVRTFLNVEYMNHVIAGWEREAAAELETVEAVRDITKPLAFSVDQTEAIIAQFVKGGQMTRGGVVNAITAFAQTVEDGDEQYEVEAKALRLLDA